MISAPGPAMLDDKLFVSRFDHPFPDLYERWWDGIEWTWIDHGRPNGESMAHAPGADMLDDKLFVVTDSGSLWERHWRTDLGGVWVWEAHGRPGNQRIIQAPGAAMAGAKLFVVTETGNLWERLWRSDLGFWVWEDHGRPNDERIVRAPGAAMLNEKLFVVTETGDLWERHWRADLGHWVWEAHGRPAGQRIITDPGAAMMNEKLFVATETGNLWERHWRGDLGRWAWADHGRPGNQRVTHTPGAAMASSKLFVTTEEGHLWERRWRANLGHWAWGDHGQPPGTRVETAPGAAMMDSKLFVGAANSHLFERVWTGAAWEWVDHGTALHDSAEHVIGQANTSPALVVAVMGDGFDEGSIDSYRDIVQDKVAAVFRSSQLAKHAHRLQLIRIDVISPVNGVTERTYNEMGTPETEDDDMQTGETVLPSRLGMIGTGIWSHCWIETRDWTIARITNLRDRFAPAANHVVVIVNSATPGGCNSGLFAAFTRGESIDAIAHELGHNLFGLGDEYNNDDLAFTGTHGAVNLSEQPPTWATLKWANLVSAGTPLPTLRTALPSGWNSQSSVGAFEGGGAKFETAIFRPALDCRMNQNSPPWCPVCAREIDRIFGALT